MERSVFADRLTVVTKQAIDFARDLVQEELPDDVLYLIRPNTAVDDHRPRGDDEIFVTEWVPDGQIHVAPMDAVGTVDYFWRDHRVPAWINLHVARADRDHTYIFMNCTGLFTKGELLLNGFDGLWPFHLQYPLLPLEWSAEREAMRRRRKKSLPTALPPVTDLAAKHGKFRLENRLIDAWKVMVDRQQPPDERPDTAQE